MPADLELLAGLPSSWGFPGDTRIARAAQGTNNQTFTLRQGNQRFVLRVSQTLSAAQVRAEHAILRRLRLAGLPFQVPEPVAAPDGSTVVETAAGPATVCRWIPGVRPDLGTQAALERFGRAAGLLGDAMLDVPLEEGLRLGDWRGDPLLAHPAVPRGRLRPGTGSRGRRPSCGATARSARWRPPRPARCPGCCWPGRSAAPCGGRAGGSTVSRGSGRSPAG